MGIPVLELTGIGIFVSPFRRGIVVIFIRFAALQEAARPHGFAVGSFRRNAFVELAAPFPAVTKFSPGQNAEDAVAGTVGKVFAFHSIPGLRRRVVGFNRFYTAIFHSQISTNRIEQQGQILFAAAHTVKHTIPARIVAFRIGVQIFQKHLFHDTGFFAIVAPGAANPHSDFAGSIAAQHGAIVNQYGLYAFTGSSHSG